MIQLNLTPFPVLTTKRLLLRQLEANDAEALFSLRADDSVNKYLDRTKTTSTEDCIKFIQKINNDITKNELIYWAIALKPTNKLIGTTCVFNFSKRKEVAEIGYELHPDFQGKGIMQEAISKVIEFGFQTIGLATLEAFTHKDNLSSTRLLERNNFKLNRDRKDDENKNYLVYSLDNLKYLTAENNRSE